MICGRFNCGVPPSCRDTHVVHVCMCMYVYVCMYVCVCMHVNVCMCMYACVCRLYVCMLCVRMHAACVCMYVYVCRLYVCMLCVRMHAACVCMYVYVYMSMYACVCRSCLEFIEMILQQDAEKREADESKAARKAAREGRC